MWARGQGEAWDRMQTCCRHGNMSASTACHVLPSMCRQRTAAWACNISTHQRRGAPCSRLFDNAGIQSLQMVSGGCAVASGQLTSDCLLIDADDKAHHGPAAAPHLRQGTGTLSAGVQRQQASGSSSNSTIGSVFADGHSYRCTLILVPRAFLALCIVIHAQA